jgi:hypothetical protein
MTKEICVLHPQEMITYEDAPYHCSECAKQEVGLRRRSGSSSQGAPPTEKPSTAESKPDVGTSEREPPNSPARPIGPHASWYMVNATQSGSHPHPLRSNPTEHTSSSMRPIIWQHHSPCHGSGPAPHSSVEGDDLSPMSDDEELLRFQPLKPQSSSQQEQQKRKQTQEKASEPRLEASESGANGDDEASDIIGIDKCRAAKGEALRRRLEDVWLHTRPGQARKDRECTQDLIDRWQSRQQEGEEDGGKIAWAKGASGMGPGEGWYKG